MVHYSYYTSGLCLFFPDFSLSDLKLKNNIVGHVTGILRDKMLEGLGLTPYLKDPMCSRSSIFSHDTFTEIAGISEKMCMLERKY
jgi:hypothetical protein